MSDPGALWSLDSTSGYSRLCALEAGADGQMPVRLEYRLPDEPEWAATAELATFQPDLGEFQALADSLTSWLAQPLGALARDPLMYSVELGAQGDRLTLEFGYRGNLAIGADDIGCLVQLGHGSWSAQVAFVTDVTCLALLLDGLGGLLS